jgi:hypothetical protein
VIGRSADVPDHQSISINALSIEVLVWFLAVFDINIRCAAMAAALALWAERQTSTG